MSDDTKNTGLMAYTDAEISAELQRRADRDRRRKRLLDALREYHNVRFDRLAEDDMLESVAQIVYDTMKAHVEKVVAAQECDAVEREAEKLSQLPDQPTIPEAPF